MTPSIEDLKRGLAGIESVEHCLSNGMYRGSKNNSVHLIQAHSYIETLKNVTESQIKELEPDVKKEQAKD